jgi:hypothetical protein
VEASTRVRNDVGRGTPPELIARLGDTELTGSRAALGADAFERALAEGSAMEFDAAVAYVLDGSSDN